MPVPKGTRFRYKKGTKMRLAFSPSGKVVEAKNMMTGDTHTYAEFKRDRKTMAKRKLKKRKSARLSKSNKRKLYG